MSGAVGACDVVVVGSGVAGMAAAVEVAEAGLTVAVHEAEPEVGGASAISGGRSLIVGSPLQEALGFADDAERALAEWERAGGGLADMEWARFYVENSRAWLYEWGERAGIEWCELRIEENNSVPRSHLPRGGGPAVVELLRERAEASGARVHTDSPVERVLRAGGRVAGVRAGGAEIGARAVVVCAGGFVNNPEMLVERAPRLGRIGRLLGGGGPSATGGGQPLLSELGASFCQLDNVWLYPVGTPNPRDPRGWRGLVVRGIANEIWVNERGERFHDENLRGGGSGAPALLEQPGATAWGVFDEAEAAGLLLLDDGHYGTALETEPARAEEFWRTSEHVWRADSAAELAARTGLPAAPLEAAIGEFNEAVTAGRERDRLGRDLRGARPLGTPLLAIQYMPIAQKNFGGVRTDLACRVLSADGPVEGVYAAGEVAGMAGGCINGASSLEGTMFGPCWFSGRVAGRAVAADLGARS